MKKENIKPVNLLEYGKDDSYPSFLPTKEYENENVCLSTYLYRENKEHLQDEILFVGKEKVTFQGLFELVEKTALSMLSLGMKKGDSFFLCGSNTLESLALILAASRLSLTVFLVSPHISLPTLEKLIEERNIKVFFLMGQYINKFKYLSYYFETVVLLPSGPISLKNAYSRVVEQIRSIGSKTMQFRSFLADCKLESLPSEVSLGYPLLIVLNQNDNHLVFYNEAIIAQCKMIKESFPFQRGDLFYSPSDFYSVTGLTSFLLAPLSMGVKTLLSHPYVSASLIHKKILFYKPNIVFLPLPLWTQLIKVEDQNEDLSFLKEAYSFGNELLNFDKEAIESWLINHQSKASLVSVYTLKENGGLVTSLPKNPNSLLPYEKLIVVESNTGRELPYETNGYFYLSSPSLFDCYYENRKRNMSRFYQDDQGRLFFNTNDYGTITNRGKVLVLSKERLKIKDKHGDLFPYELERIIALDRRVLRTKVVLTTIDGKEALVAFLILKEKVRGKNKFLNKIHQKFDDYGIQIKPNYYKIVKEFPLLDNARLDEKKLIHGITGLYHVNEYTK